MTTLAWTCHTRAAPSCDMFNLGSSYFHVALTTVRHLLNANFVRYSTSSFPFISRHRQIDLHKQKVLQLTTSTFIVHALSSCMWQKNWQKLKWPIILPEQYYTSMGTNYGPVSVCLCLSQVSILSTGVNGLISFLHGGFFWPVIQSVIIIRKLKYLQN